jgi:hypothetical protein
MRVGQRMRVEQRMHTIIGASCLINALLSFARHSSLRPGIAFTRSFVRSFSINHKITATMHARAHGPLTDLQRLAARMTVRVECVSNPTGWGCGCLIDAEWTVVTAKHVVAATLGRRGACQVIVYDCDDAPHTLEYSLKEQFAGSDVVTLQPATQRPPSACAAFFERRAMAWFLDPVFNGARVTTGEDRARASFVLSPGSFHYVTPTDAMTSGYIEVGWGGGPVFHFHDIDTPTLCAILLGKDGDLAFVSLLPRALLTDTRASVHFGQHRPYNIADLKPFCSASSRVLPAASGDAPAAKTGES